MKLKLKYYLRGLGLGIVVMAVIMCIRGSNNDNKMTDEEIMARAKQLGMIESTVLIDTSSEEDNDVQETDAEQPEDSLESEDTDEQPNTTLPLLPDAWSNAGTDKQGTQNDTDTDADIAPETQSDTEMTEDSVQDTQSDAEMDDGSVQDTQSDADMTETGAQETLSTDKEFPKVIIISNGESSYTVSKKLAEIGVVESASDFDTYLCEHGYDKKIRAGTYTIPIGATDEQMAKIVTGSKATE